MSAQANDHQQEQWLQFLDKFRLRDEEEWRKKGREIRRWAAIYKRYGLSKSDWQAIFDRQQGRCPICGAHQDELSHPLEIDQDLATGKIRGLLCRKCNSGIALLGDDVERLQKAIGYLKS